MSEQRDQFAIRVNALTDQVKEWAASHEWVTKTYAKKLRDVEQHIYEVPALLLQRGPIRVLLDPIAYDVPGTEGVVDLYLMPTYDDAARLYFENGQWMIHFVFPPDSAESPPVTEDEALPLSETTINQVLDSIAAHAVPSF